MADLTNIKLNNTTYNIKSVIPSNISSPLLRVSMPISTGTLYQICGSTNINVNFNQQYGSGYFSEIAIPIPSGVRVPTGYYSVQITCGCNDCICYVTVKSTTLTQINVFVYCPIAITRTITFYVDILGF